MVGEDGGSCVGWGWSPVDAKEEPRFWQGGKRSLQGAEPWQEQAKGEIWREPRASIWDSCWQDACAKCLHSYSLLLENSYFLYESHHLPVCHGYFGQGLVDWYGVDWLWNPPLCFKRIPGMQDAGGRLRHRQALVVQRLELFRIKAGGKDKVSGQQSTEDKVLQCWIFQLVRITIHTSEMLRFI